MTSCPLHPGTPFRALALPRMKEDLLSHFAVTRHLSLEIVEINGIWNVDISLASARDKDARQSALNDSALTELYGGSFRNLLID